MYFGRFVYKHFDFIRFGWTAATVDLQIGVKQSPKTDLISIYFSLAHE